MFKKKGVLFLAVALILAFTLVGCGGNQASSGGDSGTSKIKDIIIGSGGAGGSWYLVAAQLSELLQTEIPGLSVSVVEGGAISNVRLTNEGKDMDMGMAALPDVIDGLAHQGSFKDDNINDVAPIINFASDYVQFTVLADSGINSIADLNNKKIMPGPNGWGIEAITKNVLALYDLDYDKIKANGGDVSFVSWGEAPSLLKDGHGHMAAFKGAVPVSNVMEIEATNKAKILSIEEDKLDEFINTHEGYFKGTIPAGSYQGQTEDALTIAHTSVFLVNKNLPDDLVYNILKVMMENTDKLNKIEGIKIGEDPLKGINPELLHPGAKLYYEEAGLL